MLNYVTIGQVIELNTDYKDDSFFLPKGTKGKIDSLSIGKNWFMVDYNGMKISTPSEYFKENIPNDSIVITQEEAAIYKAVYAYISTLEEIAFGLSINEDFDMNDRKTWPGFLKGLDAAHGDIMERIENAIKKS